METGDGWKPVMDAMVRVRLLLVKDRVVTEIPLELMINAPIWRQESRPAKGQKILPEPADSQPPRGRLQFSSI